MKREILPLTGYERGERAQLAAILSGGRHAVRKLKRAQILLAAAAGTGDETIAGSAFPGHGKGSRQQFMDPLDRMFGDELQHLTRRR
jgi:hypothetical protein